MSIRLRLCQHKVVLLLLLHCVCFELYAHESRPAYLEVISNEGGGLEVNWTRPVRQQKVLKLNLVLPASCQTIGKKSSSRRIGLSIERWYLNCGSYPLVDQKIGVLGIENTISDVLLRYTSPDGKVHLAVLSRKNHEFVIPNLKQSSENVFSYYLELGITHIFFGFDHLLFIFALLLLIEGLWPAIKTITAFTFAHSISLAAAILGFVNIPTTPVEAIIALSIVMLAAELLRPNKASISRRFPWVMAAVFGLIHGLGFAGALTEIGLPETEIPLALLMFNLGVEAGQILFVMAVAVALTLGQKLIESTDGKFSVTVSYTIGGIGAFWLIERISNFY